MEEWMEERIFTRCSHGQSQENTERIKPSRSLGIQNFWEGIYCTGGNNVIAFVWYCTSLIMFITCGTRFRILPSKEAVISGGRGKEGSLLLVQKRLLYANSYTFSHSSGLSLHSQANSKGLWLRKGNREQWHNCGDTNKILKVKAPFWHPTEKKKMLRNSKQNTFVDPI